MVWVLLLTAFPSVLRTYADVSLTVGQQNIVKRAYQMTNIKWTPVANITGWGGGVTYKAGKTYTGLPYGQPVYASYVPWTTSLVGFIEKVNDPGSKMYTSSSTYNQVAPYYSIDCSAFVSWAWGLSSRQTTSSIKNFATQISTTSYANAQVGDCLCLAGSHVVLITDITYDSSGAINSIEISESTVNSATYYCCQKTRYGTGGSYALSKLKTKYFDEGYILYRSKTRDSVTYTHSCASPLPGDSCTSCGIATCSHSYSSTVTKAATCEVTGTKTFTCSKCGDQYTETIAATGHNYGNWTTVTAAGCTTNGQQQKTCSNCGNKQTQTLQATGHSYQSVVVPATCKEYEKLCYTCSMCNDVYYEYMEEGWSTEKPSGIPDDQIQTKTQYRYSDYSTTTSHETSLAGYTQVSSAWEQTGTGNVSYAKSWPSGFDKGHSTYSTYNKSAKTASETATDKTTINSEKVTGYIYWHWCRGTYQNGPINRKTSDVKTSEFSAFHAFYSTSGPDGREPDGYGSVTYPNASCCKDTHWYYNIPVYTQTYTTYRKLFTYGKWGEWSQWGDAAYSATSTRKVETRIVYRYTDDGLAAHQWNSGVVTTTATCTRPGVMTYTCTECGEKKTENIAVTEHNYQSQMVHGNCITLNKLVYTCTDCNASYEEQTTEYGSHQYVTTTVYPSCTTEGYTVHDCALCDDFYRTDTTAPTDHQYVDGVCINCEEVDPDALIKGDLDGDGEVTAADAVLLARYLADLIELDEKQRKAADIDNDGEITSADSVILARFLAGLIDNLFINTEV